MNQLIFLIAAAFMVIAGIYLGQQGLALARVNKLMNGVVKSMNETKPFALSEPQQELAAAVKLLRRVLNAYSHGTSTLLPEIAAFLERYPKAKQ